jgi:hypothetical protein
MTELRKHSSCHYSLRAPLPWRREIQLRKGPQIVLVHLGCSLTMEGGLARRPNHLCAECGGNSGRGGVAKDLIVNVRPAGTRRRCVFNVHWCRPPEADDTLAWVLISIGPGLSLVEWPILRWPLRPSGKRNLGPRHITWEADVLCGCHSVPRLPCAATLAWRLDSSCHRSGRPSAQQATEQRDRQSGAVRRPLSVALTAVDRSAR